MTPELVVYRSLDLRVEAAAFVAERAGLRLELEPKAFELLVLLLSRNGRLLTKQEILDVVWTGTAVTDNALTRVVAQLRKAIGDDAREARYLETVPTKGYRWIAPVEIESSADAIVPAPPPPSSASMRTDPPTISRRAVLASAVGVAAGAGGWVWWERTRDRGPQSLFPQQVTVSTGLDTYPALSFDGARLAYSSDRSGAWEIYVRQAAAGTGDVALTSDGAQNLQPAWSPDGTRIAFHSMRRGGIWAMASGGGPPVQVSDFGSCPAWSPDGSRIAFQSEAAGDISPAARPGNPPPTIWVVDIDGGQPRPVTRAGAPPGGHGAPAWSRDGSQIAFVTADFALSQVWGVDLAGGDPFRIASVDAAAYDPRYLADGSGLLFASGIVIWRVPLDARGRASGTPVRYAPVGIDSVRYLSTSRSGRVALASLNLRSSMWSVPVDEAGMPSGDPRPLTNDTRRRNSVPAVSPDGRRIAMVSSVAGGRPGVWVMNADGTGLVEVARVASGAGPGFVAGPAWTPDSRGVLYRAVREGVAGLWRVDLETRREEQVASFGTLDDIQREIGLVEEPELSPDGQRIVYARLDPQTATKALYVRGLTDPAATRLTTGDPPASYPAWSPDGRWIACELQMTSGTQTAVLPATGGAPRVLTASRGHSWVHGWSPDSTRIVFAGQRDGVWNLYWVSRDGGPERQLTRNTRVVTFLRYPAWSPKGDSIVYEVGEVHGNVWVLDLA